MNNISCKLSPKSESLTEHYRYELSHERVLPESFKKQKGSNDSRIKMFYNLNQKVLFLNHAHKLVIT